MIGALGFLSPWMLIALGILPLLWLLLRLTPPRPMRLDFPPTRLLIGLEERQTGIAPRCQADGGVGSVAHRS
jgi:hypothetical protein